MAPFLFPYPTTGVVTFSNVLHDPTSSYTTSLADATAARTRLHVALNAAASGEPGSSALAVLEAVNVYHPYLLGIIACLDADELLPKGDPTFPWKSSLTHYTGSAPQLSLPSIHAEHFFVALTYTLALANYAHGILTSLPVFESQPSAAAHHMSSDDEKKTTAGLARAVDFLCQASGVAQWAAEKLSPAVESARIASGGRLGRNKWPIESGPETFRGLSMILLADAHVTAIRKLLFPVLPHTLFAPPGPPLPPNHPSPSLLGKLNIHVAELYTSARALLKVHDSASASGRKLFRDKDSTDIEAVDSDPIPELKRYLRKEALLSSALAYKWIGVDAGENSKGGTRIGEAVAWVKEAQARLDELEDGSVREKMKGLGIGKANERRKEARKARKGRVERELEDIAAWVRAYTRMNDTVAFQPVPSVNTLVAPPGRPIFSAKIFTPPEPKFVPSFRQSDDDEQPQRDDSAYAGKGNYF